jgi:serralysin
VDTVRAVDMGWTLAAGFENLHINNDELESLVTGIGNALDNFMRGGWFVRLEGLAGDDTLVGTAVEDELLGGDGNDSIFGDQGPDMIDGGAGNDTLDGGFGGNDSLTGGSSADIFLFAHAFEDPNTVTDFATATDKLRFDGSSFTQIGTSGNFVAGDARFSANSTGTAQDASDRLIYNTSTGELWYDRDGNGATGGSLVAILESAPSLVATDIEVVNGSPPGEVINGTSGNDTLTDTTGHDTINGLAGNDTINGGSGGSDIVDGGSGRDSLQFMSATSAVVVTSGGFVTGGGPGSTRFTNIEKVVTGDFNDQLTGNAAAQNLTARSGMDTLWGAGGIDTLWGGAGADTFIFREHGSANADVIGDWTSGSDTVALEDGAFSMIGPDGDFAAGDARFWASSTGVAHDADDRVIYNTNNGQLYYDFDGNGSGAAQLIATLTGSPTVAATDISVI